MVELIGKTEIEAESYLNQQRKKMRVIERDGESSIFTMDYWPDRVNVVVKQGKISKIAGIG